MTIDDSVFAPVAAKTNLYRDLSRDTWRIRNAPTSPSTP